MTAANASLPPASRAFFATARPHGGNMTCVDCPATTPWRAPVKRSLDSRAMVRALVVFLVAAVAVTWLLSAQSTAATMESAGAASIVAADTTRHATAVDATVLAHGTVPNEVATPDPNAVDTPEQTAVSDSQSRVLQNVFNGVVFGLLLALASVGLSLIYGTTGLSNFAHGEQVTLGAILAYVFCQLVGLPLILSALIAVALSAASCWMQDAWLWHPLRKRRVGTTQQMIVTIGLSMALQYGYQFFFGGDKLRITTTAETIVNIG